MAYEFRLPDLGEGLTEGEVARWLVAEGQEIAEDDPLVEIQTDKTTVEVPSPAAGRVTRILVAEGETVPVGRVLVVIGDGVAPSAEERAVAQPSEAATPRDHVRRHVSSGEGGVRATPLVRRLAQELGVELGALVGTGPQGRITEEDVREAAMSVGRVPGHLASRGVREGRREPLRGVRRQIAEHLTRAHQEIPAVTYVEECDFTEVDRRRLVPLVLRATASALLEFPELNARLEGDEIVYLDRYDIGVAVRTDEGLVVPVVRGCDTLPLEELEADVTRLVEAAREGRLAPEELRGSTFTVTSAGKLGGLFVTPLINHPEVGILGIHRIGARPVARDGEVDVREMGNVSVTFDHRVVDGARAAAFTLAVIARLESGSG